MLFIFSQGAQEPANFLAAPAPDYFSMRLRLLVFFQAAPDPAPRSQKHPAPAPQPCFSCPVMSFMNGKTYGRTDARNTFYILG